MLSRLSNSIVRSGRTKRIRQLSTEISDYNKIILCEERNNIIKSSYAVWIAFGGIGGGVMSAGNKMTDIENEPYTEYDSEIEKQFGYVYNTGRVVGYGALGFVVGLAGSATAPISFPAYYYWKEKQKNK